MSDQLGEDDFRVVTRDGKEYRFTRIASLRAHPTYTDVGLEGGLHVMVDADSLRKYGMTPADLTVGREVLIRGRRGNSLVAFSGFNSLEDFRLP